ncbi:MAG: hypothetical protein KC547_03015 [Anaerolineae bacterium]|nr:hypothetical protein [Anaerolineae bacterium]
MNTSTEAIKTLETAQRHTTEAVNIIDNLLVAHDYQDVASLVGKAAVRLLEAANWLMQSQDTEALAALESADDLLDAVYDIIDADLDDVD